MLPVTVAVLLLVLGPATSPAAAGKPAKKKKPTRRPELKMDVVDWGARIFTVPNFISDAEADELIELGHAVLTRQHGNEWEERHAYSNVFYDQSDYAENPMLKQIEERIARLTMIRNHADEPSMMFTRQIPGVSPGTSLPEQAFRNVHHDKNQRENRVVTVLVYLSSARRNDGGHTLFPCLPASKAGGLVAPTHAQQQKAGVLRRHFRNLFDKGTRIIQAQHVDDLPPADVAALQECNQQCLLAEDSDVLSITPTKGMAVVTWHVQADGRPNYDVWHAACQALDGEHRYAIQKFKEFPRISGEYVVDERTKQPVWRDLQPPPKTDDDGKMDLYEIAKFNAERKHAAAAAERGTAEEEEEGEDWDEEDLVQAEEEDPTEGGMRWVRVGQRQPEHEF